MVLAPLLILAIWSSAYVREALDALSAPGVPVELRYKSQSGQVVRLHAASYALDWRRGELRLTQPKVIDPGGGIFAQIDALRVSGLGALLFTQPVVATGSGLSVKITRLKSGRFSIQDYLPVRTGPPSKVPFDVRITNLRATFVDLVDPTPYRIPAQAAELRVSGVGDEWVASSRPVVQGIGRLELYVDSYADLGLAISARTKGLEVASLLPRIEKTPNLHLPKIDAGALRLTGPVHVFLPKDRPYRFEAMLQASGTDLRYEGYALDNGNFKGLVSSYGAAGSLNGTEGGSQVSFVGSEIWSSRNVGGNLKVEAPDSGRLPAWAEHLVPKGLAFRDARFSGWVAYSGPNAYRVSGSASTARLTFRSETATNADMSVRADPSTLFLGISRAEYLSSPMHGLVAFSLKSKQLHGAVAAENVDLRPVAAKFGVRGVSGQAQASAAIVGPSTNPNVSFVAKGSGLVVQSGLHLPVTHFDVAGVYRQGSVVVERGAIRSPDGLLAANGSVKPGGGLNVDVIGRGLKPSVFNPKVGGEANFAGKVMGTFKAPVATGRVEGYGLSYNDQIVPSAAADVRVDRQKLAVSHLAATRGASRVEGSGSYVFRTGGISGALSAANIQGADYFGDAVVGSFSVPKLTLGGTLRSPTASGTLSAPDIFVQGVRVQDLLADASLHGTSVQLLSAKASTAGGVVTAKGSYDLKAKRGTAGAQATDMSLADLLPSLEESVALGGHVHGQLNVSISDAKIASANGSGRIEDMVINDTPFGSGPWLVSTNGHEVRADAEVGLLDRYISLSGLSYNLSTEAIGGVVDLYHVRLQDFVAASTRYLPHLSFSSQEDLQTLTGQLDLGATLSGTAKRPEFDVSSLQANDVTYKKQGFGTISGKVALHQTTFTIPELSIAGPPGAGRVTGSIDTEGPINISGDFSNLDLRTLGVFDPRLALTSGTGQLSFDATGSSRSPDIRASIEAKGLLTDPLQPAKDQGLRVLLDTIQVSEKTGLHVAGSYFYNGFQGSLEASSPFAYPASLPPGPRNAKLTLANRSLKEIAQYVQGLDGARSDGTLGGEFQAQGTSDALTLSGQASLQAGNLAWKGVDDTLKNAKATLTLQDKSLAAHVEGTSSRGGTMVGDASTGVEDIRSLVRTFDQGRFADLLNNPFSGKLQFNQLSARQGFPGHTYVAGTAIGALDFGGTLKKPSIGGSIDLSNVDSVVPALQAQESQPSAPPVNPTFDVALGVTNPAHVRSSAADLYVLGNGRIQGTLNQPEITAAMSVDRGTVRLPASIVRVEPGGTVTVDYREQSGQTLASVLVDLTGYTTLAAPTYGDNFQSYDITLGIRGNLLADNGLSLTAQSDPPGLGQDQILSMLGETDILTGLGSGSVSETEARVRQALAGYAIPLVTDPFTQQLARTLGLQYLNVEYNQYEQATISLAKMITPELFLEGRRQLFQPPPGFPQRFDIRLVYRPRRLKGILRRFTLSFGADQDRPWKFALEYGFRF